MDTLFIAFLLHYIVKDNLVLILVAMDALFIVQATEDEGREY